jgi:transposase-like protein
MKRHGSPEVVVTDGLRSYRAAMNELGVEDLKGGPPARQRGRKIHTVPRTRTGDAATSRLARRMGLENQSQGEPMPTTSLTPSSTWPQPWAGYYDFHYRRS